jgi:ABC-type sulfate transport system permease component
VNTWRAGWLFPVAALLFVAAVAGPIVAVLAGVTPGEAVAAFSAPAARSALDTSLRASLSATLVATILGVPAGYYMARCAPPVRAALIFTLALPLALPPVASGIILLSVAGARAPLGAWLAAHGIAIPDSQTGVAIAEFFVSGSFVAIAATAAFSALDPIYEDAARTLGAGEMRIFARVALPAAAANIAIGVAFAWLRAIGEYGATSVLAYHPTSLPVALYVALSASGVQAALALAYGFIVLAAAVLFVQWVLQRRVVG